MHTMKLCLKMLRLFFFFFFLYIFKFIFYIKRFYKMWFFGGFFFLGHCYFVNVMQWTLTAGHKLFLVWMLSQSVGVFITHMNHTSDWSWMSDSSWRSVYTMAVFHQDPMGTIRFQNQIHQNLKKKTKQTKITPNKQTEISEMIVKQNIWSKNDR